MGRSADVRGRSVSTDELAAATPWRTFRWYKGQKHYSGLYWSATTRAHVAYESRLELARLLSADFDPEVSGIVSQPFVLAAVVGGQRRKHVPDYLLTSDNGPIVVDVKPQERLGHPKVASTLAWTKRVVESRGWRFEVAHEPPEQRASNIRSSGTGPWSSQNRPCRGPSASLHQRGVGRPGNRDRRPADQRRSQARQRIGACRALRELISA